MELKGIHPACVPRQIAYRNGVGNVHGERAEPGARVPAIGARAVRPVRMWLPAIRGLGIRPVDVLLTLTVIGAMELNVATATGAGQAPLNTVAYLFGAAVALPVLLRRRWPLAVLIACAVLLFVYYSTDRRNISPVPLLALPVYDAAVAGFLAWAIAVPAVFMVIGLFVVEASEHYGFVTLAAQFSQSIVLFALAVALGEVVRGRRKLAAETAERLRVADEEREVEAARRVAEERLRIARDLHDTVAHSMATITVQAGSALHVLGEGGATDPDATDPGATDPDCARPDGGGPDGGGTDGARPDGGGTDGGGRGAGPPAGRARELRAALGAIRDTSKSALTEMRATLGQLRSGTGPGEKNGEGPPGDPSAGLDRLPALCDAVTAAGAPVRLEVTGEKVALPPAVDQAAYRILQESLTNVLRHAGPDATAAVRICYRPADVTITVADDGAGAGAGAASGSDPAGGHGITGMTERSAVLGGELTAGPRPGGGFQVTAWLPVAGTGGKTGEPR